MILPTCTLGYVQTVIVLLLSLATVKSASVVAVQQRRLQYEYWWKLVFVVPIIHFTAAPPTCSGKPERFQLNHFTVFREALLLLFLHHNSSFFNKQDVTK